VNNRWIGMSAVVVSVVAFTWAFLAQVSQSTYRDYLEHQTVQSENDIRKLQIKLEETLNKKY